MEIVATKFCNRCQTEKPVSEFWARKDRTGGLQSKCKSCAREMNAQWYAANRERNNAKRRERYAADPEGHQERLKRYTTAEDRNRWAREARVRNIEKVKERNRAYYLRTAERQIAKVMEWQRNNPEKARRKARIGSLRRRARKRAAGIFAITDRDMRRLLSSPCAIPGCASTDLEIDHIIPISRGGRHSIGNLQALCASHNGTKQSRTWTEFRLYLLRKSAA